MKNLSFYEKIQISGGLEFDFNSKKTEDKVLSYGTLVSSILGITSLSYFFVSKNNHSSYNNLTTETSSASIDLNLESTSSHSGPPGKPSLIIDVHILPTADSSNVNGHIPSRSSYGDDTSSHSDYDTIHSLHPIQAQRSRNSSSSDLGSLVDVHVISPRSGFSSPVQSPASIPPMGRTSSDHSITRYSSGTPKMFAALMDEENIEGQINILFGKLATIENLNENIDKDSSHQVLTKTKSSSYLNDINKTAKGRSHANELDLAIEVYSKADIALDKVINLLKHSSTKQETIMTFIQRIANMDLPEYQIIRNLLENIFDEQSEYHKSAVNSFSIYNSNIECDKDHISIDDFFTKMETLQSFIYRIPVANIKQSPKPPNENPNRKTMRSEISSHFFIKNMYLSSISNNCIKEYLSLLKRQHVRSESLSEFPPCAASGSPRRSSSLSAIGTSSEDFSFAEQVRSNLLGHLFSTNTPSPKL